MSNEHLRPNFKMYGYEYLVGVEEFCLFHCDALHFHRVQEQLGWPFNVTRKLFKNFVIPWARVPTVFRGERILQNGSGTNNAR
jgi:hypothetical protein